MFLFGQLQTRATDIAEIMDEPLCDTATLHNTYRQFAHINRVLSGWRNLYVRHLRPILRRRGAGASVLDLGCGGGDILRQLAAWSAADGLSPCFIGADPDTRSIEFARTVPNPINISFLAATSAELLTREDRFDIVLSNHVLHHLTDCEVVEFCADSVALSREMALHADIYRHPVAYLTFPVIGGWFRNSYILPDGLQSIRRSFTPAELRALLPQEWKVECGIPFRLIARWTASENQ